MGAVRVALVDDVKRNDKVEDRCRDLALILCADCVSRAGFYDGETVKFFLTAVWGHSVRCVSFSVHNI